MKKKIVLIIALLNLIFTPIFAQFEIKLNEELFISKLSEKTYIVTHYFPWESNSMILEASGNKIILIDTP